MCSNVSRSTDRWLTAQGLRHTPQRLRPWLTHTGSLTERVMARCKRFALRVLREGRFLTTDEERRRIGLARGRSAWVREVLLIADDVPVVFAHTVAHPCALRGPWHMARTLGGQPLGAALFADPRIVRGRIHAARLTSRHRLHRMAASALTTSLPALWGRRSHFERHGHRLLVTEVFLPSILSLPPHSALSRHDFDHYRIAATA